MPAEEDPLPSTDEQVHTDRLLVVRRLLDQLDRREALAMSASAPAGNYFGWASLEPGSGLTAEQEDFVDYWSPDLVLAECRAKRELVCALDEWALTAAQPADITFVNHLLGLINSNSAV